MKTEIGFLVQQHAKSGKQWKPINGWFLALPDLVPTTNTMSQCNCLVCEFRVFLSLFTNNQMSALRHVDRQVCVLLLYNCSQRAFVLLCHIHPGVNSIIHSKRCDQFSISVYCCYPKQKCFNLISQTNHTKHSAYIN